VTRGLSAVTLHVTDMARSFAFYESLGFALHYGGPEATFSSFAVGPLSYLNLQLVDARPGPAWGRVIVHVDDVDETHARCLDAGLAPDAPPADAPWGERYFHIKDPDGHEVSIARYL
jgi:catechol 2,3-dioxygenase-like lactoylglutathione lyase family enzyme